MSKTEELLTALIDNADVENFVPSSRVEQILLCCIKKQSAEDLGPPQSRVEALLQELATVIKQGGGSGQSESFIEFQSSSEFSLATSNGVGWDGEMEYSNDKSVWFSWVGESITAVSNSGLYTIYLRGSGNTTITTNNEGSAFVITGTDVKCRGNIESLLDHAVVATGGHPNMADGCYAGMFSGCTALTTPPALPATTLAYGCYMSMFSGCTALTTAPALPATTLTESCYESMFSGCTALTTPPALPATTLTESCYESMFSGCTALTTPPALPATTLTESCYSSMFEDCTALTTAPALPATTLTAVCYDFMFKGCTALTKAPALPATTLTTNCYMNMFEGCTALTTAPALPATTLTGGCYREMFKGCTALTTPPALPATTLAYGCYMSMFSGCTSLDKLPALPATTLVEQCYNRMFRGCTSIVLVSEADRNYNALWRIPMTGDVIATGDKTLYIGMIFDGCSNIPTINFDTEYYTLYDPVT